MRIGRHTLLLVMMAGAAALTGCGIFDTRNPEPPTQVSSSYVPPTDPSIVFQNMVSAFHDLNTVNYVRSFSDTSGGGASFRFEPSAQSGAKYAAVFAAWNRQSEQQYFEAMKSQLLSGGVMTLQFTSLTAQRVSADSAQYEATYSLVVPHAVTGVATTASGRAQFWLAPDQARLWSITSWVDLAQNPDDFTWSDFKGIFGQ